MSKQFNQPIPEDEQLVPRRKGSMEELEQFINRLDKSKTRRLLNAFYSAVVATFMATLLRGKFKYPKSLGMVIGLVTFLVSRRIVRPGRSGNNPANKNQGPSDSI